MFSALLAPFAAIYGFIAGRRMRKAGRRAAIPVICVGNLTVGGAGKTPTALAVGRLLIAAGRRVFFLSRGYGGTVTGPVRVDLALHRAADVGDEPLLLAHLAPTIVAADRVAGAELARGQGAGVIVMDDGFQNPSLHKNLSILVIDGRRGAGNGYAIPAGPLRAPLHVQLERAQALLVIGPPSPAAERVIIAAEAHRLPIFHGRIEPEQDAVAALAGARILGFAGIGDPEKFFATLAAVGVPAPVTQPFPDHHRYSRADGDTLLARAAEEGLVLVTTEKDLVRIAGEKDLAALAKVTRALPVTLEFEEFDEIRDLLLNA